MSSAVNGAVTNGVQVARAGLEQRLDALRRLMGKADGDPLRIVGVGAGAWGSVFVALIQVSIPPHCTRVKSEGAARRRKAISRSMKINGRCK